jgi:hypothetical protein
MNSELRDHIRLLEERLFDQTVRNTRSLLETLLSQDFREIGSSGRLYRYEEIIGALLEEPSDGTTRQLTDFEIQTLAPDVVLATYRSERIVQGAPPVRALRSSIWRRGANGAWRMVFHQGTPER